MHLRCWRLKRLVVAALVVGLPAAGSFNLKVAAAARHGGVSGSNQVLLAAASPFEDLTESALANDSQGMRQALKAYSGQAERVNRVLSGPARREMAALLARIRRAEAQGAYQEAALNSVEAYPAAGGLSEP
jgi:hypothetical protein